MYHDSAILCHHWSHIAFFIFMEKILTAFLYLYLKIYFFSDISEAKDFTEASNGNMNIVGFQ